MRFKKKLNISSLGAAICNVAVFKNMKEREFKDEIYISYAEQGVILEALNQEQWEKASSFVEGFLNNKKIALLCFGFEKEAYEELIVRGLKDYTRKMKDYGEECPYINIIHYQKLRKSCEYMDKERYVEPLKDWQRKNKKNPNFAFLIVEPIHKFEDVKKNLLEFMLKKEMNLQFHSVSCLYFLLLFFNASIKEEIRENFEKTYIEISLELNKNYCEAESNAGEEFKVNIVNYTFLKLDELDFRVVPNSKHLSRLGLEFISCKQIESQVKKVKLFLTGHYLNGRKESVTPVTVFEQMHSRILKEHGQNCCIILFKKSEKEKYSSIINKFMEVSSGKNIEQLSQQIEKNVICGYQDIQLLGEVNAVDYDHRGYKTFKACINDCPFLLYEYENVPINELQTFMMYVEQLKTYYCTYLVRFYGISIKYPDYGHSKGQIPAGMTLEQKIEGYTYYLIFDFQHRTLQQMQENDMILDNFQIAQIILQIMYLINFLHSHEQPRSLGSLRVNQIYLPFKIVLPYLKNQDQHISKEEEPKINGYFSSLGQGFEGDVKITGELMNLLIQSECQNIQDPSQIDDHFCEIIKQMIKDSKYDRITLQKCLTSLEKLLLID